MMTINTNNVPRPLLQSYELSPEEVAQFDYLEGDALDSAEFFRYRGLVYDLGEFVRIAPAGAAGGPFAHYDHEGHLTGWDAIHTDTFFSGVLVRLVDDGEKVVVGYYYC
jgi:hypothetical protein